MSALSPPWAQQQSSHSAALVRQFAAAMLGAPQPGTLALGGVGGVVNSTDLAVTQNGSPNMSVNVAGGGNFIPQTIAANGGVYFGLNDATVNLAIAASNPTNPRIDLVASTVNDAAYSGGTNNWALQVVTGTPAGSPVAPSLPSSSNALANVAVAALAVTIVNANITDKRSFVGFANATRNNPAVITTSSTLQSVPNNTPTTLISNTIVASRGAGSYSVSTGLYTVAVPGLYHVDGSVFPGGFTSAAWYAYLSLMKNGVSVSTIDWGYGGASGMPFQGWRRRALRRGRHVGAGVHPAVRVDHYALQRIPSRHVLV